MKKLLLFILTLSILASCSTSNEVVSNKLFQKRKYKKGWHVNSVKKVDKLKKSDVTEYEEELVADNYTEKEEEKEKEADFQEKENQTVEIIQESNISNTEESNTLINNTEKELINLNEEKEDFVFIEEENSNSLIDPIKKEEITTSNSTNNSSDYSMLLLVILSLIIPPIAVGLVRGWSSQEFLITLILFLVGWGLFALSAFASIAALAAVVYALLIVFDVI